jgi:hypothetical protein
MQSSAVPGLHLSGKRVYQGLRRVHQDSVYTSAILLDRSAICVLDYLHFVPLMPGLQEAK